MRHGGVGGPLFHGVRPAGRAGDTVRPAVVDVYSIMATRKRQGPPQKGPGGWQSRVRCYGFLHRSGDEVSNGTPSVGIMPA